MGDSAVTGDGLRSIVVRLVAAAIIRLVKEGMGMTTWVGNHTRVSAMCSDIVSHTHVR